MLKIKFYDTIVIGSGIAGYNTAITIKKEKRKSVVIITEGILSGTSRNTGSDKQTYYKLGLSGEHLDSVRKMAQDLFNGGSMDGDNALCEAALSARSFFHLVDLGVPFPMNRYGEYVGYKTDHDLSERATSAGPLTSKFMTEKLEEEAKFLNVEIIENLLAIKVLTKDNKVIGLMTVNNKTGEFEVFKCNNVVLATGGPSGIYYDSVYPVGHTGMSSLALNAGASLQNMTEWQYGLASINPRWNVSGTYMQVLPRFISIDEKGEEREFLLDYFKDPYKALDMVFLKGYQWPFDSKKVLSGSSIIDILVYKENVLKGRKVFLDYKKNPFGLEEIDFTKLNDETYDYLKKANALFGSPIERLEKMNNPAIELYKTKGVDLYEDYLEIALCSQHNNGGIAVDKWWMTSVVGLFACGECSGTHGVSRPGGSALNESQVGSFRAGEYISYTEREMVDDEVFTDIVNNEIASLNEEVSKVLSVNDNTTLVLDKIRKRMSENGAAIRNESNIEKTIDSVNEDYLNISRLVQVPKENSYLYFKIKDTLIVQLAVLESINSFKKTIDKTRGSALYYDKNGLLREGLDEIFRFSLDDGSSYDRIQEIKLENGKFISSFRKVRPIPESDDFFENVWSKYRENKNIY